LRNIGRSSGAAQVVLIGLDNEAMGLVREAIAAEAVLPSASVSFGDALLTIDRARPDVVIVGYNKAVDAAMQLADELRRAMPTITLIALAQTPEPSAILGAMRAGYKEFVVLPADANRLRQTVRNAAASQADEEERGRVVAIVGAKGGVGTTTIAVHLAAELAAIHRVLLVDLDLGMGDAAPMMDLQSRDSLGELLSRADRLDERVLTAAVVVHKSKVHVMTTPDDVHSLGEVRADDLYNILSIAAKAYQWVIVDCGTFHNDPVVLAMQVADIVMLVTTPDVMSVRDAFRRVRSVSGLGVEKTRIRLVVNRWHKAAYVSKKDIQQNLGIPVSATVADDPRHVEQALNEGKLIRDVKRGCDAARDIANLVALLTEEGGAPTESKDGGGGGEGSGGWLSGLFGRR
jgi:pilus assembly protein CpaE